MNTTTQQDALIDAAEERAKFYDGDDREGIKVDVMNAFFAGAEYTQAAANKAAEEGARPTDNEEISIGSPGFFKLLISLEHEPCLEKRMNVAEFVDAHIDKLLADRASRQVANKAEVEPVTQVHLSDSNWMDVPVNEVPTWKLKGFETRTLYGTPPATTGASTVLTDERIEEIAGLECDEKDRGFKFNRSGKYSVISFARAIEREVAAQAGQVAVPEGWALVPIEPTDEMILAPGAIGLGGNVARIHRSIWSRMLAAAPSNLIGCTVPAAGWKCTRAAGHEGPCAATPSPARESK